MRAPSTTVSEYAAGAAAPGDLELDAPAEGPQPSASTRTARFRMRQSLQEKSATGSLLQPTSHRVRSCPADAPRSRLSTALALPGKPAGLAGHKRRFAGSQARRGRGWLARGGGGGKGPRP